MAAGHAGLTQVYTAEWRNGIRHVGDELREELGRAFSCRRGAVPGDRGRQPARCACPGGGFRGVVPRGRHRRSGAIAAGSGPERSRLLEVLFLDLLDLGYYIAPRGYMALSLALTRDQLADFVRAVQEVLRSERAALWAAR